MDITLDSTHRRLLPVQKTVVERYTRLFMYLLVGFIALVPLNNCFEIAAMMQRQLHSNAEVLTPLYVKTIKDLFLVLSMALALLAAIQRPSCVRIWLRRPFLLANLFLILVVIESIHSIAYLPADVILMGIRGYWTILFLYIGALFHEIDEFRLYKALRFVFFLHIAMQSLQLVTDVGFSVYGEHRSPGLFVNPSTAAAFALVLHHFGRQYGSRFISVASILSVVVSNSSAGLLVFLLYYLIRMPKRFRHKLFMYPIYTLLVLIVGCFIVVYIGTITGRHEGFYNSLFSRIDIIQTALSNWNLYLFGGGMGIATSQALTSGFADAIIPDNTFVETLYNMGIFSSLVLVTFVFLSLRQFEDKLLPFVFICFSMTNVVFEMNPVIQIILILMGSRIGKRLQLASSVSQSVLSGREEPGSVPCL
jgi:hypothetical protein